MYNVLAWLIVFFVALLAFIALKIEYEDQKSGVQTSDCVLKRGVPVRGVHNKYVCIKSDAIQE